MACCGRSRSLPSKGGRDKNSFLQPGGEERRREGRGGEGKRGEERGEEGRRREEKRGEGRRSEERLDITIFVKKKNSLMCGRERLFFAL